MPRISDLTDTPSLSIFLKQAPSPESTDSPPSDSLFLNFFNSCSPPLCSHPLHTSPRMAAMHCMCNCNESNAMITDVPLPTNTSSKKKVGTKGKGNKENLPAPFCNATSVALALSTEDDLNEDPVETLVEPEKHALLVSDIKEDEPLPKRTKKQPLKQLDNGLDMQKFLSKKKSKKGELIEANARIVELGAIIMSMKDKEKLRKALIAKLAKHKAPPPLKVIAKPSGQPGHKGPGGYCLQEEMGLSGNESKYNSIWQQVRQISNKYNVCGDKTITKLHPEVMAKICKEVSSTQDSIPGMV
ncbi:hypothetical protein DACRYDRAFT_103994 [Dacryopinax primogenitus]|uniref:Uncharacterized protein n=1 Tax=Dacryopinax primogenitus (strain DJM 731) TaxID=1858805 RepID=M5GGH7_DACPD|nr:uncharacterized protein DACRYDRAFT_103994 [Dacryopinax primogenitus]EJU05508.1 hypothetical protein DACRYDRAFT_103994 [Dacryopinax primogenitus]